MIRIFAPLKYTNEVEVDEPIISHRLIYVEMVVNKSSAPLSQDEDPSPGICNVVEGDHTASDLFIGGNQIKSGLNARDATSVSSFVRIVDTLTREDISLVLPRPQLA